MFIRKKHSVPDHWRRALRLSIAVFIPISLGYGLLLPEHLIYSKQFAQAMKWCAMTAIVVTFPLIGKVGQVGAERAIGTVLGGLLGFTVHSVGSMFWNEYSDGVFLSIAAALAACAGVIVGNSFSLDLSAKLFTLTFLLVTCGAQEGEDPLRLAISRTSGILSGVLLMLLLTVVVLPKSATMECIHNLEKALESLSKLNQLAWKKYLPEAKDRTKDQGGGPRREADNASKQQDASGSVTREGYESLPSEDPGPQAAVGLAASQPKPAEPGPSSSGSEGSMDAKAAYEKYEEQCEKVLTDIYQALFKLQENMGLAKSEVLAGTCGGHLILLPGLPLVKAVESKHMPWKSMEEMATAIRRVARLLLSLISSMEEDFERDMKAMLCEHYPDRLMVQLAEGLQDAIQAMCHAFPQEVSCGADSLAKLTTAVGELVAVSDHHRQRIVRALRGSRRRKFARDAWQTLINTVRAQNRGSAAAPEEPVPPYSMSVPTTPLLRRLPAGANAAFSQLEEGLMQTPPSSSGPSWRLHPSSPLRGATSAAGAELEPARTNAGALEAMAAQLQRDLEGGGAGSADISRSGSEAEGLGSLVGEGGVRGGPWGSPGIAVGSSTVGPGGSRLWRVRQPQLTHQLHQQQEEQEGQGVGSPLSQSLPSRGQVGPAELSRLLKPLSSMEAERLVAAEEARQGLEQGRRVSFQVAEHARSDTLRLAMFPETAAGQVAQVRWYSFQFMMEELVDEMAELQEVMCKTLSKLP